MSHRHTWALLTALLVILVLGLWYVVGAPGLPVVFRSRVWLAGILFGLLLAISGLVMIQGYERRFEDADTTWKDELAALQRAREMSEQRQRTLEQEQRDHAGRWQEVQQTLEHARKEVETLTRDLAQERTRADRIAGEVEQWRKTQGQQEPVIKELRDQLKSLTAEKSAWGQEKAALTNDVERYRQQASQLSQQAKADSDLARQLEKTKEALATAEEEKARWIKQAEESRKQSEDSRKKAEGLEKEAAQKGQQAKSSEDWQKKAEETNKKLEDLQKKFEDAQKKAEDAEKKARGLEGDLQSAQVKAKEGEGLTKKILELEKLVAEGKAAAAKPAPPSPAAPPVPAAPSPVEVKPAAVSTPPVAAAPPKPASPPPATPPASAATAPQASPTQEPPRMAPVPPPAPKPAAPATVTPVPLGGSGEADVLVVDGNGTMLNQFRNELYKLGFSVHVARTGQDGIRKLGLTAYAFLLVNLDLTDMTWEEFVEKVKKTGGGLGDRIVCCIVPGGKAESSQENLAKSGLKWFKMPMGVAEFQGLIKQVAGRT